MQGVDPEKFTAFNVLEDQELRAGTYNTRVQIWAFSYGCRLAVLELLGVGLWHANNAMQASKSTRSGPRYRSFTSTRSSLADAIFS